MLQLNIEVPRQMQAFAKAFKNYYCSKLDTIQHYTVKSTKFDPYFGRKMKET